MTFQDAVLNALLLTHGKHHSGPALTFVVAGEERPCEGCRAESEIVAEALQPVFAAEYDRGHSDGCDACSD